MSSIADQSVIIPVISFMQVTRTATANLSDMKHALREAGYRICPVSEQSDLNELNERINTEIVDHNQTRSALKSWVDAGHSVGIDSPGAMQQAKHLAKAAISALMLNHYSEVSPSDITGRIIRLRRDLQAADLDHQSLSKEFEGAQQRVKLLEDTLKDTESQLKALGNERDKLLEIIKSLESKCLTLEVAVDDQKKGWQGAAFQVEALKIEMSTLLEKKVTLEAKCVSLGTELSDKDRSIEALSARIAEALDMRIRHAKWEEIGPKMVETLIGKKEQDPNERIKELEGELNSLKQNYVDVMAMWACDKMKLREIQTLVTDSKDERFGPGGSGLYAAKLQPILDRRYPSGLSAPYVVDHADLANRIDSLDFDKEWEKKKEEGYQYGPYALKNVKFGFEIALEALKEK